MGFVAIEDYTSLYFNLLFGLVLMTFFSTQIAISKKSSSLVLTRGLGIVFFCFTLLYIGFRPIDGKFIDMTTYARTFERMAGGDYTTSIGDPFFNEFTKLSAKVLTVESYFFICTLLYVFPMYLVSKKWFKNYWFYAFLMLVGSLSFWNYGTNGIRNGIATSLFLLGISREKKIFQIFWIFVAFNFHKSIIIPAAAFVVSNIFNQPKKIIWFWILSIPLSLAGGAFWQNLFVGLGFDDRNNYLTTEADTALFSNTGFRWDFLLYSAAAVFTGWYFIQVKGFKDKFYFLVFNTYVIANAFWILVIQSNFSNRFAYLSWFMMAIVIAYPFLNGNAIRQPLRKLGFILLAYFSFTYILMFLYK
jgi:hypothetical protein